MATIIAKNEELEKELQILMRALELQSSNRTQELELLIGKLQNQLTEERQRSHELRFAREQDNTEMLKLENRILELTDDNRDLAKVRDYFC